MNEDGSETGWGQVGMEIKYVGWVASSLQSFRETADNGRSWLEITTLAK